MEIPLLNDIITIFVLSIAVIFICHRLRVPGIVGFFLTGILAGPHGFGLIGAIHEVEVLAEIGVVLLLFAIGIEFSFNSLLEIKKTVFLGGPLQVLLTITAAYFLARLWQRPLDESIFVGCLISLSSTAIVLKLLQEKAQVDSPHGRSTLGILIFQDIAVVPMMLIIPFLAGAEKGSGEPFYILAGKGLGIILLVIAGAKWIVPQVLYQIARTRNREIFLLTIIVICLVTAWITSKAGLSLALGAFLAGLVISESEYSHQALSNILPFRDIFTSFFFVSLGMLLDVSLLFRHPGWIFLLAFSVLILKSLLAGLTAILLGLPLRTSILLGLTLGQIGEFSFVLLKTGVEHGLFAENSYQIFLASSVLTLAATPFVFNLAPHLAGIILRLPIPARLLSGIYPMPKAKEVNLKHHIIIIGFGINGRNVARAASLAGISYVILEMNPETVKKEQTKGVPIHYGDGTQEAVLEHAKIEEARVVVVAINDPTATRRITEVVRGLAPKVYLIVRTRYISEMKPLYEIGVNEVIPEEFETSVEIFSRVLANYLVPRDEIEQFTAQVRSDGYEMFRSLARDPVSLAGIKLNLPDVEISTLRIADNSLINGKTLAEVELRKRHGVTVLAIRRDSQIMSNPDGDTKLLAQDVLFLLGSPDNIAKVARMGVRS